MTIKQDLNLVRQVQRLDGFEEAQPNADAVLPALMTDATAQDLAAGHVVLTLASEAGAGMSIAL